MAAWDRRTGLEIPSHSLAFSRACSASLRFLPALNQRILYELGGNMPTTGAIGVEQETVLVRVCSS